MPLPVLQKVLGHSSTRTTALYWKNSQDPKEKVISDKWLNGKLPKEPPKLLKTNHKNYQNYQKKKSIEKFFLTFNKKPIFLSLNLVRI
jgi:hypothetical protein